MNDELKYFLDLPENAQFNFLSDDGTIGYKSIQVMGNNEYLFKFENNVLVQSINSQLTKSNRFYSNTKMTDTGINPNGVRIIGLGNPEAFESIKK